MNFTDQPVKNSNGVQTYQGRWGYYPCKYETFRKLKRLNYLCLKARIEGARWFRWGRKAEHNRKYEEPQLPEKLCTFSNVPQTGYVRYDLNWWNHSQYLRFTSTLIAIETAYETARFPKETRDLVTPLRYSAEEIDEMLNELEVWYDSI